MLQSDLPDLIYSLTKNYDLDSNPEVSTIEALRLLLEKALDNLLQNDPERLLAIMYRLDINETHFRKVMEGSNAKTRARELAELVLEREWKRLEFKKNYKPPAGDPENEGKG